MADKSKSIDEQISEQLVKISAEILKWEPKRNEAYPPQVIAAIDKYLAGLRAEKSQLEKIVADAAVAELRARAYAAADEVFSQSPLKVLPVGWGLDFDEELGEEIED